MSLMNAPECRRPESLLAIWRRSPLWRQLLASLFLAVLFPLAGYGCGRMMDCSAGQVDGQCGLITFMGVYGGLFFGGGVLIFSWIAIFSDWFWKRRQERLKLDRS